MLPRHRRGAFVTLGLLLAVLASGCASGRRSASPATVIAPLPAESAAAIGSRAVAAEASAAPDVEGPVAEVPAAPGVAGSAAEVAAAPGAATSAAAAPGAVDPAAAEPAAIDATAAPLATGAPIFAANGARPRLRDLCRQGPDVEGFIDESRQFLQETFCGATLWFDGLLGGTPDVANARSVSGRVELSTLYTDWEGVDFKGRVRLEYELPNLERRVRLFLGRVPEDDFVADRQEGLSIRSAFFDLEDEDEWLAGLGYSLPGPWMSKVDFRVGGRVRTSPEVFVQGRFRHNVFQGERTVWRLRETLFWENREGFGSTSSMDADRLLRDDLLLRWGNVATWSESTDGLSWRSALLLYINMTKRRAMAGELFVRGATDAEVGVREYGGRVIYRQPLLGRRDLFGDFIGGYTFPQRDSDEHRQGSGMVGVGLELVFGREE